MRKLAEDLRCTAPNCRRALVLGTGHQWVTPGGEIERYCWTHWAAMFATPWTCRKCGGEISGIDMTCKGCGRNYE